MAKKIYDIDLDSKITPLMVRDAIVQCFWQAHCLDTGLPEDSQETNKTYCKSIVKKAFADTNGDFDHPTKDDIINCTRQLASFSKSFRDPSLIEKHYEEIGQLIERL